jgi:hypothetical protein
MLFLGILSLFLGPITGVIGIICWCKTADKSNVSGLIGFWLCLVFSIIHLILFLITFLSKADVNHNLL